MERYQLRLVRLRDQVTIFDVVLSPGGLVALNNLLQNLTDYATDEGDSIRARRYATAEEAVADEGGFPALRANLAHGDRAAETASAE